MEEVAAVSSSLRCSVCSKKGVKSAIVVTDPESGEIICSSCGIVITQNTEENTRPEWRSFGSEGGRENNRKRTGKRKNHRFYSSCSYIHSLQRLKRSKDIKRSC